ncbi:hypothetical protein D9M71_633320 [compost metagenome]
MQRHLLEQREQVGIAQADAAMRARLAHRLAVRSAVQVDVAAEGVDRTEAVAPRLAAAQPENPGEDPVALRMLRGQRRRPDLAGPAPPHQHRRLGQTGTDSGAHLMAATRRATGALLLARPVEGGGDRQAQAQLAGSEAVQALVGDGNMQQIEHGHGFWQGCASLADPHDRTHPSAARLIPQHRLGPANTGARPASRRSMHCRHACPPP